MAEPLRDHLVPIVSGLTPAEPGAGRLSKERAAELDAALRDLDRARGDAADQLRRGVL